MYVHIMFIHIFALEFKFNGTRERNKAAEKISK